MTEGVKELATKTGFDEGVAQEVGKAAVVAVEVARAVEVAKDKT